MFAIILNGCSATVRVSRPNSRLVGGKLVRRDGLDTAIAIAGELFHQLSELASLRRNPRR